MDAFRRRHKVLINPAVQGSLVARLCLYWFAYHLVLWHAMFTYYYLRIPSGLASQPRSTFFDLYGRFAIENKPLVLCALSVTPLILWDVLQVSHRIVGPLVRVQNVLKRLARGEKVSEVTLRDGDMLTELRDALNEYLAVSGNLMSDRPVNDRAPQPVKSSHEEALLSDVQRLGVLSHSLADDCDSAARRSLRHS